MGLDRLIEFAVAVVILAAATGQLPRFANAVRMAQYKLLKESQASKWPKAMLLPTSKTN